MRQKTLVVGSGAAPPLSLLLQNPSALEHKPLTLPADEVRKRGLRLFVLREQIAGPSVHLVDGERITLTYDETADDAVERITQAMPKDDPLLSKAGIGLAPLSELGQQAKEATKLRISAERALYRLRTTHAVVKRKQRRMVHRLVSGILRKIASLPAGHPERTRLESDAAEVLAKWRTQQKALQAHAEQTREANKELKATINTISKNQRLFSALTALQNGEALEPELEAELAEAYLNDEAD